MGHLTVSGRRRSGAVGSPDHRRSRRPIRPHPPGVTTGRNEQPVARRRSAVLGPRSPLLRPPSPIPPARPGEPPRSTHQPIPGPEVRERAGPRLPICLTQAPRAVLGGNGAGSVLAATPWGRGTDAASDTSSQFDELGATLLLM